MAACGDGVNVGDVRGGSRQERLHRSWTGALAVPAHISFSALIRSFSAEPRKEPSHLSSQLGTLEYRRLSVHLSSSLYLPLPRSHHLVQFGSHLGFLHFHILNIVLQLIDLYFQRLFVLVNLF